jgi:hypothetical protein
MLLYDFAQQAKRNFMVEFRQTPDARFNEQHASSKQGGRISFALYKSQQYAPDIADCLRAYTEFFRELRGS